MVNNSNNCAVEGCRNTSKPRAGGTYFILPDDEKRAEKWKNDLRLNKQLSSGEELFICTDHFNGSHFVLDNGTLLAPNSVSIPQSSEIEANNHIDSDVSSDQEMEIQDEEEVFLPLTSILDLISPDESPEVLNTPSFINIDPLQSQSESQIRQLDVQTDGHKQESNLCRVCLLPGSTSTLPTVLRDTYWSLCNAGVDDQSSMAEPALCVVCRRLLYNAHKFMELCRAAHEFLTQIFDIDQLEKFTKNLHKSFNHPNLTTVHNVVEKCNYFNIKEVSENYDRPKANKYRSKIIRDGPKVHRDGLKVHRDILKVHRDGLIKVHRDELKVHTDGLKVHRDGLKVHSNGLKVHSNRLKVHSDGLKVHSDGLKVHSDGLKVHSDGLKVQRDGPNVNEGARIMNKIGPKIMKVPNVRKELLIEVQPSQYHINIHDSGSDTNCNDDDDETSGKADLEVKSKNINTLIAIAERRKSFAPQKNTAVKKINKCRRRYPAVRKKTTKPKIIKILENKKLTFPKKRIHYVHDPKVFDEYIETSRLTPEDQKKKFEDKKLSVAFRDALYKCDICYKIFNTEDTIKRHMECHSDKLGEHVCEICHLHFATAVRLYNHRRRHKFSFKCKKCIFKCDSRTVAQLHIFQTHQGKRYTCDICKITYHRSTSYLSHMRIHHPPSHACQLCGYSFLSECGVAYHKQRMHRFDDRPIPEDGPVCSKCNIKFVDKDSLITHLKVSPCANNRRLPNCKSRTIRLSNNLMQRPRHSSMMTCEKCNLKLNSFNQYKQHFVEKHPNETMTQRRWGPQALCEICGKIFINITRLGMHMPTHGTADNFKCDECGCIYKSKAGLYCHKKKHQGVMFPCKVCKREFSHSGNRDRHYKYTHTNVEIVKCECCDKEFKSVIQKAIHVTHVHMNVPYKKRNRKREGANAKFNKKDKTEYEADE